ncbi:hypothetical protein Hanom_Chr12g01121891 [Helianthus anomalus]
MPPHASCSSLSLASRLAANGFLICSSGSTTSATTFSFSSLDLCLTKIWSNPPSPCSKSNFLSLLFTFTSSFTPEAIFSFSSLETCFTKTLSRLSTTLSSFKTFSLLLFSLFILTFSFSLASCTSFSRRDIRFTRTSPRLGILLFVSCFSLSDGFPFGTGSYSFPHFFLISSMSFSSFEVCLVSILPKSGTTTLDGFVVLSLCNVSLVLAVFASCISLSSLVIRLTSNLSRPGSDSSEDTRLPPLATREPFSASAKAAFRPHVATIVARDASSSSRKHLSLCNITSTRFSLFDSTSLRDFNSE